jgi:hypothetical protein
VFLPGSNLRLLQGLAKGVPILYKTPALLVQYCDKGVSDTRESQTQCVRVGIVLRDWICETALHKGANMYASSGPDRT